MTKEELINRLSDIEWEDFEVKGAKSSVPKSAWETVSAFANTNGGWIIFGIKQNEKQYEITGVNNAEKIEHNWLKYNNTKPIYDLDFDSTILKFKINNNVPDNRLDIIVQMIKENNTILLQEIADKLKVSKRTIRRDIEKLKAKKILQREGGERSGYWKIIKR